MTPEPREMPGAISSLGPSHFPYYTPRFGRHSQRHYLNLIRGSYSHLLTAAGQASVRTRVQSTLD